MIFLGDKATGEPGPAGTACAPGTGRAPGTDAAGTRRGAVAVALVPGALAPLLPVDLPPGLRGAARHQVARRRLTAALGVAPDAAELHPYSPGRGDAAWQRAILADGDQLDQWRREAATLSPAPRAILPDYLALPAATGIWVLDADEGNIRARLGPFDGFTAEPDLARTLLARELETADAPRAVVLLDHRARRALPEWSATPRTGPGAAQTDMMGTPGDDTQPPGGGAVSAPDIVEGLAGLARHGHKMPKLFAHGELAADLGRNEEAALADSARALSAFALPLGLATLALAVWSATALFQIGELTAQARQARAEASALAAQPPLLPGQPILDLERQVSARLGTLAAALERTPAPRPDPVALLERAARVIAPAGAMPDEIGWGDSGSLDLRLRLASFAALEDMIERLGTAGLDVTLGAARASDRKGDGGGDGGANADGSDGGEVVATLSLRDTAAMPGSQGGGAP